MELNATPTPAEMLAKLRALTLALLTEIEKLAEMLAKLRALTLALLTEIEKLDDMDTNLSLILAADELRRAINEPTQTNLWDDSHDPSLNAGDPATGQQR